MSSTAGVEVTRTLGPLGAAIRTCIRFEYPGSDGDQDESTDEFVDAFIRRNFFAVSDVGAQQLYHRRQEEEELHNKLAASHLLMVIGDRGSGKSTTLRALEHRVQQRPQYMSPPLVKAREAKAPLGLSIEFLDFEHDDDLTVEPGGSIDISGRLYERLYGSHILATAEDAHAIELFESFILQRFEGQSMNRFRAEAVRLYRPGSDLDKWMSAARQSNLASERTVALSEFESRTSAQRLRFLLRFLGEVCRHRVHLFVDNIDQLSPETQADLVGAMYELTRAQRSRTVPVIAIRRENWPMLHSKIKGRAGWDATYLTVGEVRDANFDVVYEILKNRLRALSHPTIRTHLDDRANGQPKLVGEFSVRSGIVDPLDLLRAVEHLLDTFVKQTFRSADPSLRRDNQRFVGYLLNWFNGNIRDIAIGLIGFIETIINDREPLFRLSEILDMAAGLPDDRTFERNRRAVRTMLFRYLMFYRLDGDPHPPSSVMIFRPEREYVEDGKPPQFFARYRVLRFLTVLADKNEMEPADRRTRVDVGLVVRTMHSLGLARRRVLEILNELRRDRYPDDIGLVWWDPHSSLENDDTEVEITKAGRYLCRSLCVKCEYMYHSAMEADVAATVKLPRRSSAGSDDGPPDSNDLYRTRVAVAFFCTVLLPKLREEHPIEPSQGSARTLTREAAKDRLIFYADNFGYRGKWLIEEFVESIEDFVGSRLTTDSAYESVRTDLQTLRDFAEVLHNAREGR